MCRCPTIGREARFAEPGTSVVLRCQLLHKGVIEDWLTKLSVLSSVAHFCLWRVALSD